MPQPNREIISFNMLNVDRKTAEVVTRYLKQGRTKAMTFQQLIIHAEKTGFDAATADLEWEEAAK